MKELLIKFWKDEEGATAIEYGLIAGLMAVVVIAGLALVSDGLDDLFTAIQTKLEGTATEVGTAGS
ncbi:Flp family type IVb pilin [Allopusillimonas ginsengisoli]|uniref:Flp family type IVb pilin n=1 Tax=Allopusillimonas ginsengisoli TaxID=453575 RepID=UPI0010225DF1|nr:Flp family type IVb pilin [Allopusillimonas ginsengisoli]TEA80190.1 Flp family type IVb pilin [Allopusillimonas ginsengisoli]